MARVGYPDEAGLRAHTRNALRDFGVDLNINHIISNADNLAAYVIKLAGASFAHTTLHPRCRELIVLATARRKGRCAYVMANHQPAMVRLELAPAEILRGNVASLDASEQTLYAALCSRDSLQSWSEATVRHLASHFNDGQIVEILILEAIYELYANIANDLDVEVDARGDEIAKKFPAEGSGPQG
ncbi:hypothetical protein ACFC0M_08285 [Streptomyces sp. NPDC056149]|uniref:hypothetical protein n=1 Tax=unclassified Streptomyces TaxID=2593676 RepID=UPI00238129CD|nr:hypothetical protein [Streptomyces sp. WZ-12]